MRAHHVNEQVNFGEHRRGNSFLPPCIKTQYAQAKRDGIAANRDEIANRQFPAQTARRKITFDDVKEEEEGAMVGR